ncbi:MAG: DUF2752 domain-containing protein [Provencibacterium sp.]|nr:DUF2752 domain-containing protein [Provencibacterium sp.]
MRHRIQKSVYTGALFLLAGLFYAFLYQAAGVRIPCLVHLLTGLYCPSCGLSRMCIHLLHGEWSAAMRSNPCLFFLLPVFAVLAGWIELSYWRTGSRRLTRAQSAAVWGIVAVLLLFGVLRNLPPFALLRPAG